MIALESRSDWNIDALHWECYSTLETCIFGSANSSASCCQMLNSNVYFFPMHTHTNGLTRLYYTQNVVAVLPHFPFSWHFYRWKSVHPKTACLCPVFLSCLLTFYIWQLAPFRLSLSLSVAPEPNYPQRTQGFYHKARLRSSVHHAHYTSLQNAQHTCRCLGRRADEAVSNPPLIWRPVRIHPPFWFESCSLERHFVNCVSYLLYWSLAAFCLLAKSHSSLQQMGVCYQWSVETAANVYQVAIIPVVSVVVALGALALGYWPKACNQMRKL